MTLLFLDCPLHFCSHSISFLFHLSLTHGLIFLTQNEPFLESLFPKTFPIPFNPSCFQSLFLLCSLSQFMESLSTQSLKLKTAIILKSLFLPYQVDHQGCDQLNCISELSPDYISALCPVLVQILITITLNDCNHLPFSRQLPHHHHHHKNYYRKEVEAEFIQNSS